MYIYIFICVHKYMYVYIYLHTYRCTLYNPPFVNPPFSLNRQFPHVRVQAQVKTTRYFANLITAIRH